MPRRSSVALCVGAATACAVLLAGARARAAVDALGEVPASALHARLSLLPQGLLPPALVEPSLLAKRRFKYPDDRRAAERASSSSSTSSSKSSTNGTGRYAHRYFEFGVTVGPASPALAPGISEVPTAIGLQLADNDVILGRLFFILLGAAARTQDTRYTGSSYVSDARGNVWRVDSYRRLTPSEIAERDAAVAAAIAGRYVGELNVWFGGKDASTQGWEYRVGDTVPLMRSALPIVAQFGLVLAHVSTTHVSFRGGEGYAPPPDGKPWVGSLYYSNIGAFVRVIAPVTRYFEVSVNWDINSLALADGPENRAKGYRLISPLRAGLAVNLTDYVYLRNEWTLPALSLETVRWSVSLGGRL